jgi:hypothetical protein
LQRALWETGAHLPPLQASQQPGGARLRERRSCHRGAFLAAGGQRAPPIGRVSAAASYSS